MLFWVSISRFWAFFWNSNFEKITSVLTHFVWGKFNFQISQWFGKFWAKIDHVWRTKFSFVRGQIFSYVLALDLYTSFIASVSTYENFLSTYENFLSTYEGKIFFLRTWTKIFRTWTNICRTSTFFPMKQLQRKKNSNLQIFYHFSLIKKF